MNDQGSRKSDLNLFIYKIIRFSKELVKPRSPGKPNAQDTEAPEKKPSVTLNRPRSDRKQSGSPGWPACGCGGGMSFPSPGMPPYLPGMFYDPSFPMGGVPPMSFQPSFYSLPGGPPQSTLAAFPVPIPFPIPVPTGSSSSHPPPPPLPVSPAPAPPTAPLPTVPPPTSIPTERSRMHSMADMMMNTMMEQFRAQLRGKKRKSARFLPQLAESEESSEEEEEVVPPCPADFDDVTEAPQIEEIEGIPASENIANNKETTAVPMDQSPAVSNKDPVGILSRKKKYVIPVAQNPLPPSVTTSMYVFFFFFFLCHNFFFFFAGLSMR
ncbi:hypothetical protein ISCGN_010312 [Ixodes scapularis]